MYPKQGFCIKAFSFLNVAKGIVTLILCICKEQQCQNAVTALTWLDLYCNPKSGNPLCLVSLSLMSAI